MTLIDLDNGAVIENTNVGVVDTNLYRTKDVKRLQAHNDIDFRKSIKRYSKIIPKRPARYEFKTLSKVFAERILNPITKSEVVIGLDAQKGAGKSITSLKLAEDIAREVSILEYGDSSHELDYFNPETNIAIITDESIHKVIQHVENEHQILILDDAGNSIGNRDAQTRSNKLIVKLMQTIRVKSCCIIISSPSMLYVDKQLRELCTHYMHVEESRHKDGYNLLSCKRVYMTPQGKQLKIHLTARDCGSFQLGSKSVIITRWKVGKPRESTKQMYEKVRMEMTDQQIADTTKLLQIERQKQGLEDMIDTEEPKRIKKAVGDYFSNDKKDSIRALAIKYHVSRYKLGNAINMEKHDRELNGVNKKNKSSKNVKSDENGKIWVKSNNDYKFEDVNGLSGDLK